MPEGGNVNIYVGNISPKTSRWQLRRAFETYGQVDKITIDKTPRDAEAYGFCFVEMPIERQAARAINQLNGKELSGYALTIKESGVSA
jgi:RNA recognition motif-containing protein